MIPAAGVGARMSADRPKQYLDLAGSPVILHTLKAISRFSSLKGILLGLSPDDRWWPSVRSQVKDLPYPLVEFAGGDERAQTVALGLEEIIRRGGGDDWVLVHDAVRPLIQSADIDRLVNEAATEGGLLALPVADTLKAEQDGCVVNTVDRQHLWRALTPQFFAVQQLKQALQHCLERGLVVTDEASAIEQDGGRPRLVTGSADNIKLTYPSDMTMAESLIKNRETT